MSSDTFFTQTAARAAHHALEAAKATRQLQSDLGKIGDLPAERIAKRAADLIEEAEGMLSRQLLRMIGTEREYERAAARVSPAPDTQPAPPLPTRPDH